MKHPKWVDFTKDFGDAIGGIFIGHAIATNDMLGGIIGASLILISIYLRFYIKK